MIGIINFMLGFFMALCVLVFICLVWGEKILIYLLHQKTTKIISIQQFIGCVEMVILQIESGELQEIKQYPKKRMKKTLMEIELLLGMFFWDGD